MCLLLGFHLVNIFVISDASFSENFYGLRRVSRDNSDYVMSAVGPAADMQVVDDEVQHLTRTEKRRSLFFLVSGECACRIVQCTMYNTGCIQILESHRNSWNLKL